MKLEDGVPLVAGAEEGPRWVWEGALVKLVEWSVGKVAVETVAPVEPEEG